MAGLAFALACSGWAQSTPAAATLSLHEAIVRSQASPLAHTSQDQVDIAQGLVKQAGLGPNPRLYLQSEDLRPWADNFDFPNATENYGYVGQLLELGGKRARRVDFARANERQAEANRTLLNQQIAGRLAAAYWTAVANTGVERLLQEDLAAVDEIVRYNEERVRAGATRGVDLIRVEIERDRLRLALAAVQREVVQSRAELFRQMGQPPNDAVRLTGSLDSAVPAQTLTLATLLATRADLVAAREAVQAAEADVRLQQAVGVPDLDLLAGYKRNAADNTLYSSLQLPLPFRNRNQGEIARAQASVRLAQDRLRQLELSAETDVTTAQRALDQQAMIVRDILPDLRAKARQNLTIMDDAYRTGGVDLLRFLDAERTAFDVEVSALRTLAEYQQAGLRLQLAYGVQP